MDALSPMPAETDSIFIEGATTISHNPVEPQKRSKRLQVKREVQARLENCRPVIIQQVPVPIILQPIETTEMVEVPSSSMPHVSAADDGGSDDRINETIDELINSSMYHQNGLVYGQAISELQRALTEQQQENKKLKQRLTGASGSNRKRIMELEALLADREQRIQTLSRNIHRHKIEMKPNKRPYIGSNASYKCKAKAKANRVLRKYFTYDEENFKALFRDIYGDTQFPQMTPEQTYYYQQTLKLSCNAMDRTRAIFKKMFGQHPFASKALVLAYRKSFERSHFVPEMHEEVYEELQEGEYEEVEVVENGEIEHYVEDDQHELIEVDDEEEILDIEIDGVNDEKYAY